MQNIQNDDWVIGAGRLYKYLGKSEDMEIPNGVESVDIASFRQSIEGRNHIRKLTIPGTLKAVPGKLFKNIEIDELVLEKGIEYIGEFAFFKSNITKMTLPDTIKSIGVGAFCYCSMTEVVLNESIQKLGNQSFGGNFYISKCVFPKTLASLNLDVLSPIATLYTITSYREIEIVCHFNHLSKIQCESPLICNLSVIVDDDFKLNEAYDFIKNSKKEALKARIKKITFIGYKNNFYLNILKHVAKKAGLEIEIEMIEDKNGNEKKKILENKNAKKEETLDYNTLSYFSADSEINKLVNSIKEKSNILEESLKINILSKVEELIQKYQNDLEDLKPKLETDNKIILRMYQTPQSLRLALISDLQKMDMNFINLDANFSLKNKIEEYKKIVADTSNLEEQRQVDSVENKIKQMKYYASIMNLVSINNEILKILVEIENSLKVFSLDTILLKTNTDSIDHEQELKSRLDYLYQKIKDAYDFYQSLIGKNDTSLGNDINQLKSIINFLDSKSKKNYQERINSIINKYLDEAKNLKVDSNSELNVRKELMPILEELNELIPNMLEKREILNDINESKKVIFKESNENLGDINENLGTITSTTIDILSLFEQTALDESLKEEVFPALLEILDDSYYQILNNTFILEGGIDQNLSWRLRATSKIIKKLYGIKFFIDDRKQYNEDVMIKASDPEKGKH